MGFFRLKSVFMVALLAGLLSVFSPNGVEAYIFGDREGGLPIDDAQKARQNIAAAGDISGPGTVFDRMLGALSKKSDTNYERIRELWTAIPTIPSDLYRVFVTL